MTARRGGRKPRPLPPPEWLYEMRDLNWSRIAWAWGWDPWRGPVLRERLEARGYLRERGGTWLRVLCRRCGRVVEPASDDWTCGACASAPELPTPEPPEAEPEWRQHYRRELARVRAKRAKERAAVMERVREIEAREERRQRGGRPRKHLRREA